MRARLFAEEGAERWERLASLIRTAAGRGLSALPAGELEEFARLYRRAASDLARARTRDYDPALVRYLNDLVGRAAGLVYGGRLKRRFSLAVFFLATVPRTFRRNLLFPALAFVIFMGPAVVGAAMAARNPAWADALFQPGMREVVEAFLKQEVPPGQYFRDVQALVGADQLSSFIAINNIKVALMAFALGITFCLGTLAVLLQNGLMLGAFLGVGAHAGRLADLVAIVAPHGVLELSAIFICAGAGLMMGWALVDPKDRLRSEALSLAARQAVILVVGCVPVFLVAAAIEGVLSPQASGLLREDLPRIAFGLLTGLALALYLTAGDRLVKVPEEQ